MGDTEGMTGDKNRRGPLRRVGRSIVHLPGILFPALPGPVQIAAFVLAVASTVAVALAWYGINLENGAGLAAFTSAMFTAFTVAAASLPRLAYSWLNRRRWFPGSDLPITWFTVLGSHIPLIVLSSINLQLAMQHHATYVGVSAAGAIGAVFWGISEALKAKKEYDELSDSEDLDG